jgi:pilus assembly protein TadC
MALIAINQFSRYNQTIRLKTLIGGGGKGIPFLTLLSVLETKSDLILKLDSAQKYYRYLSRMLQRMNRADLKPSHLLGYQLLCAVGTAFFIGILSESGLFAFLGFLFGGSFPLIWLRDKALQREKKLIRELPNALEIISLCCEAGLSLEQGMDQYLKNTKPGPLRDEFAMVLEQTRSGSSRKNALEAVSARLDLTDFSLFTTSLVHAERFGTGVAKTLRQLALTMRDKQSQRAEKAVQEMPVKMLLPLILFIMPVTFLIIFGPILLQFLQP